MNQEGLDSPVEPGQRLLDALVDSHGAGYTDAPAITAQRDAHEEALEVAASAVGATLKHLSYASEYLSSDVGEVLFMLARVLEHPEVLT